MFGHLDSHHYTVSVPKSSRNLLTEAELDLTALITIANTKSGKTINYLINRKSKSMHHMQQASGRSQAMGKTWMVPRTWITPTQATRMEGWPWLTTTSVNSEWTSWRQGGPDGLLLYDSMITVCMYVAVLNCVSGRIINQPTNQPPTNPDCAFLYLGY